MAVWISVISIYLGSMILVAQVALYLIQGRWPAFPIRRIVTLISGQEPALSLSQFDRLMDAALSLPVSVFLMAGGVLLFITTMRASSSLDRGRRE